MNRALILVEGPTEETFAREILAPHLLDYGVYLIPIIATTKRVASGPRFKGGIMPYGRLRKDILRLLNDTDASLVTTMFDFYGLPGSFPGKGSEPAGTCYQRVSYLEEELRKDINHPKFLPYLALHEFEAMMFVSPEQIAQVFPGKKVEEELLAAKRGFESPEEIDDSPETCPSRRILRALPEYRKPLHGPLITRRIGMDLIRKECLHFDGWVKRLETSS